MAFRPRLTLLLATLVTLGSTACASIIGIEDTQEQSTPVAPPDPVDKGRTIDFRYYFAPLLKQDVELPPVVLANFQGLKGYLSAVQAAPDSTRGYLSATTVDCSGAPQGGINLKLSPDPITTQSGFTAFNFNQFVPSQASGLPRSDGTGPIGYLNIQPTQYNLEATDSDGKYISTRSVFVSANVFTTVLMFPNDCEVKDPPKQIKVKIPAVWVFPDILDRQYTPGGSSDCDPGIKFDACPNALTESALQTCVPFNNSMSVQTEQDAGATIVINSSSYSGYLLITDGQYTP